MPYPSYRAFYGLYRELVKVGITPDRAKKLEVWEVASALGVGSEVATSSAGGVPTSDIALLRQRLAASQGLAPEPQASSTNPADISAMMGVLATPG